MDKSKIKKNVIYGFGGQVIILVLGLVVPRVLITSYGSDINGLLSTVSQIFTYMALLEAGIGQAAKNALYKPLSEHDQNGISNVASIARRYYRKITRIYGLAVILLALLLPFVIKSDVDRMTIFWVVFFQGMSGVISFYYIETDTMILAADGRGYITNTVEVVNKAASYSSRIVLAYLGVNIAFVQFAYFLITIAKVFYYKWYFHKRYSWINFKVHNENEVLPDRNSYIVTEIAWTIFSSTDMIILSMFVSTKASSVYYIYNMVFSALNVLLNAIYMNVNYLLGQSYHESIEKYEKYHDAFMSVFVGGMAIMVSTAYVVILPFIRLYTRGVTDINYIIPSLPVLFCLVQLLSWSRYVQGNLTGVAGYAKPTSYISIIEATINVVVSLIFVHKYGIVGVLIGTVVALPLKVIYTTYISDKKVMHRSYTKSLRILLSNYLLFALTVLVSNRLNVTAANYLSFFVKTIITFMVIIVIGAVFNAVANPQFFSVLKSMIRSRNETKHSGTSGK